MSPRILTIILITLAAALASTASIAVAPERNSPAQKSSLFADRATPFALR
jgi:hypothetical protein